MTQSTPKIRIVGKRRLVDVPDEEINSDAHYDVDDESGEIIVVNSTLVDATDEVVEDELASRRKHFAIAVDKLTPSEYALYLGLTAAIEKNAAVVNHRISGRNSNLCLAVQLPNSGWNRPAGSAFDAVILGIASKRSSASTATRSFVPQTDRYRTDRGSHIDGDEVFGALQTNHVVLLITDRAQLMSPLNPLIDFEIDLATLDGSYLAAAVDRAFGTKKTSWPAHPRAQDFDAKTFDAACSRSAVAHHVARLVAEFAAWQRKEQRDAEKAAAADKSKLSSSSKKSASSTQILLPTSPKLSDLYGYGPAAVWGQQLCDDLVDYAAGDLTWKDVDAGCLLSGPPGTGKTLFASALAASAGVPFVATSYADWQAVGDGHLGTITKAIKQRFSDASVNVPSIMFIDEIDTIPARGTASRHDDWWTAITTTVLECLDGTTRREGLVVIAACNNADRLDPALIRSGRLDRRFEIGLPEEDDLARIFLHHLPDLAVDVIAPVATALAGSCSGADAARIAREARRTARRAKRALVADDLLSIALPPDTRPDHVRRLVAVHEAGHAVAYLSVGIVPRVLTTVGGSGSGGYVEIENRRNAGRLSGQARLWLEANNPGIPTIIIAGNHDFYGASLDDEIDRFRRRTSADWITILDGESTTIGGTRFIGATLWTDYRAYTDEYTARQAGEPAFRRGLDHRSR